jgi:hypothetical protein
MAFARRWGVKIGAPKGPPLRRPGGNCYGSATIRGCPTNQHPTAALPTETRPAGSCQPWRLPRSATMFRSAACSARGSIPGRRACGDRRDERPRATTCSSANRPSPGGRVLPLASAPSRSGSAKPRRRARAGGAVRGPGYVETGREASESRWPSASPSAPATSPSWCSRRRRVAARRGKRRARRCRAGRRRHPGGSATRSRLGCRGTWPNGSLPGQSARGGTSKPS